MMPTEDQPARYFTCTLSTKVQVQASSDFEAQELARGIEMCLRLPGEEGLRVVAPTAVQRDVRQTPPDHFACRKVV